MLWEHEWSDWLHLLINFGKFFRVTPLLPVNQHLHGGLTILYFNCNDKPECLMKFISCSDKICWSLCACAWNLFGEVRVLWAPSSCVRPHSVANRTAIYAEKVHALHVLRGRWENVSDDKSERFLYSFARLSLKPVWAATRHYRSGKMYQKEAVQSFLQFFHIQWPI